VLDHEALAGGYYSESHITVPNRPSCDCVS